MAVYLQFADRIRNIHRFESQMVTRMLLVLLFILPVLLYLNSTEAVAAVYYVSNEGLDNNDGKSPEISWCTIARVNTEPLVPGDVVLFRRGDCWREYIKPRSGNETNYITYGAYGSGDKPLLLGSVEKNEPKDWKNEGGNIWTTTGNVPREVGNIIFDGEALCGIKVWNESDMNAQGKFWYDKENHVLKLYSSQNPASYYSDLECALRADIIDQSNTSYVIYDGFAMKYGGACGIGSANTHHIIIRNCDFSYIGGSELRNRERVRYGNAVEFWGNAHDNIVEKCRFWEIYDAAVTNQNIYAVVKQYNIRYRNNLIWNCEYSFEYWNWPEQSQTHHIYFENNTCVNAGYGWGHSQRFDPSGRHLCFYGTAAATHDIYIRNNIFFKAKGNAFFAPKWSEATMAALHMDNNCWYQSAGIMILLKQRSYTMAQFSAYQSEEGKEANSIIAKPLLVDVANGDLHLTKRSPCIDAGINLGLKADYEGNAVPQGTAADIGAYEFPNSPAPSVVQ